MFDQGTPVYHVAMLPIVSRIHLALPGAYSSGATKCSVSSPVVLVAAISDLMLRSGSARSFLSSPLLNLHTSASADSCRGLSLEGTNRPGPVPFTAKVPARKGLGSGPPSVVYAIGSATVDGHVTHQTMHHPRTLRISALQPTGPHLANTQKNNHPELPDHGEAHESGASQCKHSDSSCAPRPRAVTGRISLVLYQSCWRCEGAITWVA